MSGATWACWLIVLAIIAVDGLRNFSGRQGIAQTLSAGRADPARRFWVLASNIAMIGLLIYLGWFAK